MKTILAGLLGVLVCSGHVLAQKDSVRLGPPVPAVVKTSEDTPINYLGGVPPLFTAALDADDSTYNRPVTCTGLSTVGTAVALDTVTITNNSPGPATFVVTSSLVGGAVCGDPNDTFFTLYNGTFNPGAPLTNCLATHDDIAASANRCSTLSFAIPVGQTRVLVVSGFDNPPTGLFSYQMNFTGTTPVDLLDVSVE